MTKQVKHRVIINTMIIDISTTEIIIMIINLISYNLMVIINVFMVTFVNINFRIISLVCLDHPLPS